MTAADYWIDRLEEESEPAKLHPIVIARRNLRVVRGMLRATPAIFMGDTIEIVLRALDEAARELVLVSPLPVSLPEPMGPIEI